MTRIASLLVSALLLLSATACAGVKGDTKQEKRNAVQQMRKETLSDLYKLSPGARQEVANSAGYAVFSNIGVNVLLVSTARGWGVAHNNRTGNDTYMKMFSAGAGVGIGIKDFRGVFLFANQQVFDSFVNSGWQAGGQADLAVKAEDQGLATAAAIDVAPGIKVYQLTETGIAVQATLQGTKYTKDDELN
jgi:lipid-binding SYLF domain-containing protein